MANDRAAQPRRGAFGRCFIASFLLVLMAAAASVYLNAVDRQLFETTLLENVDYAVLGMDEDSVRSFADETILFLTDAQDSWEPRICRIIIRKSGRIIRNRSNPLSMTERFMPFISTNPAGTAWKRKISAS